MIDVLRMLKAYPEYASGEVRGGGRMYFVRGLPSV